MPFDSQSLRVSGNVYGNFHCSWIIPNFSSLDSTVNKAIESEYFQLQSYSPRWRLIIYPGGKTDQDGGFIACFLVYNNRSNEEILANINSFSLRDISGKVLYSSESSTDCYEVMKGNRQSRFSTIAKRDDVIKKLVDDVLVFCVNVSYCDTCVKDSTSTKYTAEISPIAKMVRSYELLSLNEENSDTDIFIRRKTIPVHSVILSSRSEVFQGMLKMDIGQEKTYNVQINDFEEDVVDALIQFIYTGNVKVMSISVALELLRASDKYDMDDLSLFCNNYIMSNLNEENVVQVLIKATTYNAQTLKTKVIRYLSGRCVRGIVKKNRPELKKYPDILMDILEASGND